MVKVVDMSLLADRALDLYCESESTHAAPSKDSNGANYRRVAPSVGKIFSAVLDELTAELSPKYDMVFITVPCFPITRMKTGFMISRFACRNADVLNEMGVSAAHFQEFLEKFISLKCPNEYVNRIGANVFLLNGRGVLTSDWVDAIRNVYGSSLMDTVTPPMFGANPGFICNVEELTEDFTETTEDVKYKLTEMIRSIT